MISNLLKIFIRPGLLLAGTHFITRRSSADTRCLFGVPLMMTDNSSGEGESEHDCNKERHADDVDYLCQYGNAFIAEVH